MTELPTKKLWLCLTCIWLCFGIVTHISSLLWKLQYNEIITADIIIDVGFYYHVPSLLWILYTPFLIKLYQRTPISQDSWKLYLPLHLLISVAFAPLARLMAITVDYSVKNAIGMTSVQIEDILYQARYIIFASAPRAFLSYWIVIGAIISWKYMESKKQKESTDTDSKCVLDQILVPHNSGKKVLNVEEIFWIAASKNYVDIHTENDRFKIRETLSMIKNKLDQSKFCQIHRSKIINKSAISSLKHWRRGEYVITLKNQRILTSSRTYHENVKALF